MNKHFWEFVKKLVTQHSSELKPCKFYESNKQYVNQEYKKISSTCHSKKKQHQVEYQNFFKK